MTNALRDVIYEKLNEIKVDAQLALSVMEQVELVQSFYKNLAKKLFELTI